MFIKRFKEPVPKQVKKNVQKYLKNNGLGELVEVRRASDHPEDHYLYHVIAKIGVTFSCWTSWNETTQSMNFGHYGLTYEECDSVLKEYFHRISGANVID